MPSVLSAVSGHFAFRLAFVLAGLNAVLMLFALCCTTMILLEGQDDFGMMLGMILYVPNLIPAFFSDLVFERPSFGYGLMLFLLSTMQWFVIGLVFGLFLGDVLRREPS